MMTIRDCLMIGAVQVESLLTIQPAERQTSQV
jgi:hypothetical protein